MWLLTGAHPEGAKNYTVVNRERPQFLFIYLVSSRVAGLTAGQPIPPEHSLKLFIFWNTHSPVIHHPFIAPFSSSLFPCSPWEMCGGEWEEGNWAAASPHCSSVQRSVPGSSPARTQPSQLVPSDPKQFRKQGTRFSFKKFTVYRIVF